jgi:hypothetical protein
MGYDLKRLGLLSSGLSIGLVLIGCISAPELLPPREAPAFVRDMKFIRLYGHIQKMDTGIDVARWESLSVIARGKVYLSRNHPGISPGPWHLTKWIGDETNLFPINFAFIAPQSGRLYLGIRDSNHSDNLGYFDVIVIVWREANYAQMSSFLDGLLAKDPDFEGLKLARDHAVRLQELYSVQAETAQAIEATKAQLEESRQQEPRQPGAGEESGGDPRVRELEERLADLTAKLEALDDLSRQLQQESQKSAQLSRMLEEKEGRERELIGKLGEGAKMAPLLLITSPEPELRTEMSSVRLSGAAEDDRGILRLEVFVNGRPAPEGDGRGLQPVSGGVPLRVSFDRSVPLAPGENRIHVKVTDTDGLAAERKLLVHHSPDRRNVWAVVAGINRYPNLPKLKYAVNDAREFYRVLIEKNRIPAENITLLLDEQATLRNLRSAIGTRLKEAAGAQDMVIIFFAGHGATERDAASSDQDGLEKYLLTWDTDPKDVYASALPMREIAHILGRIRSERLVFIADACYSGASGGRTVGIGGIRANVSDAFLDRVAGGRGKIIITASAANEVSVEKDELQHGVFTYYLLEGLRGVADFDRDGLITVDEIYRHVSERVPRATGQEQNPILKGSVEGSLVLGLIR